MSFPIEVSVSKCSCQVLSSSWPSPVLSSQCVWLPHRCPPARLMSLRSMLRICQTPPGGFEDCVVRRALGGNPNPLIRFYRKPMGGVRTAPSLRETHQESDFDEKFLQGFGSPPEALLALSVLSGLVATVTGSRMEAFWENDVEVRVEDMIPLVRQPMFYVVLASPPTPPPTGGWSQGRVRTVIFLRRSWVLGRFRPGPRGGYDICLMFDFALGAARS